MTESDEFPEDLALELITRLIPAVPADEMTTIVDNLPDERTRRMARRVVKSSEE